MFFDKWLTCFFGGESQLVDSVYVSIKLLIRAVLLTTDLLAEPRSATY